MKLLIYINTAMFCAGSPGLRQLSCR